MKRLVLFLFIVALFATHDAFAQHLQIISAYSRVAGSTGRVTQTLAARGLITNSISAGIVGVTAGSLATVDSFSEAVDKILNSNNETLKLQANNFLRAITEANTRLSQGEAVDTVVKNHLGISALGSNAAQRGQLQVDSARVRATEQRSRNIEKGIENIDNFSKAVTQRSNRTQSPVLGSSSLKLQEATRELKNAAGKGVFVLGDGAVDCVTSWGDEHDPQIANFVNILSHTDDAATYQKAFSNLSNGMKDVLGVTSANKIADRLTTLSNPDNCRALSPRVTLAQ